MDFLNQLIFIGAVLLFTSIVASSAASRFGVPLLLVFLALGMLAGEDGFGGVNFDNYATAYLISTIALAVILFDGGMRTSIKSFRVGLRPALSLATVGVLITAVVTGLFTSYILGLHWMQGLLLGAIVGSTDAAAVFSLLHSHGLQLKERVGATLEIESGINDPMAVFLTIILIEMISAGEVAPGWWLAGAFAWQMGLGALLGIAGGYLLLAIINRLTLALGMYPLLVLAGGLMVYGLTNVLGGSGYLAIYLTGLLLGNQPMHSRQNILRVHDGMAWLSQIVLFVLLGLLASPSAIVADAIPAISAALVLIFVARPLATLVCLAPFRMPWREMLFIAWTGLRGAVPIILAIFPLLAGLDGAQHYFNIAFFVVVASLTLQGWTLAPLSRLLRLQVPPKPAPVQRVELDIPVASGYELVTYHLKEVTPVVGKPLKQLRLPEGSRLVGVLRDSSFLQSDGEMRLAQNDGVYIVCHEHTLEQLNKLFAAEATPAQLDDRGFFGEFVLDGQATLSDVAMMYGLQIPAELQSRTLAEHLTGSMRNRPVVGDRVRLDKVQLVVREMDDGRVARVGISLHD
ncbi:cell volume regulation protein A [Methylohalomonas lacus]|uniref:Cell volume regulation protein A n=1 Tax=Methylohalomonas lacus TaxID=398773 RepID=A0AAE3L577_9GAMM|nr:potassium/proton antiporter [Methylohalomonas lacus]MCS3902847.1 cell volume regulation protein A [Methylohalomonas lacus]